MLPSVTTLLLSSHPFPYTCSPPPYLIPDLSSLFCLKCTVQCTSHLFIYNSYSLIMGQPIKTTNSG